MKKLVGLTAVVGGVLLMLVPRYILPACEYEGFARMHCSDTARAEYLLGLLLTGIGVLSFFLKSHRMRLAALVGAGAVLVAAFFMPNVYGYCLSTRMPCNYGMVPGVRFISVTGTVIMFAAGINLVKRMRRK